MVISLKKLILLVLPIFLLFTTSATFVNNSSSYIAIEKNSLRILSGENIHNQLLVASTAKILTALTAITYYNLDDNIVISDSDTKEVGSKVYLKKDEILTRRDLIYALMLRSANDAASALSFNNSDLFIYQMNELAKEIGMKNSVFANASGLDEREYNISTAYDMALLAAYASKNEVFVDIASAHSYSCKTNLSSYSWSNKHKLVIGDDDFIWGKTGYTKKSKRILVSNYLNDNMNVIIVTINKSDDWNFHRNIIKQLSQYDFVVVLKKGIYDPTLEVDYYLLVNDDIVIPLKKNEYEKVKIKVRLLKQNAVIEIYLDDKLIYTNDIKTLDKTNLDLDMILDVLQ